MNNNIDIEKTVLCSLMNDHIDFEAQQINKRYIEKLEKNDFLIHAHQVIFNTIAHLEKKDIPTTEDFVRNIISEKYDLELVSILTVTPVADLSAYIQVLKQNRYKRELQHEIQKGINGDFDIKKIRENTEKLDNIEVKANKKIDEDFLNFFEKYNLQADHLENLAVDYLHQDMLVKNEITMIAAKPSSGKSLTTIALTNMALQDNKIEYAFYFDLDNSATTLKERNIHTLRNKWGKKLQYIHPAFAEKSIIWNMIRELQNRDLTNTLIVFDSAKNFMLNGDRDKNKDVSKLMEIFKSLRNKGATVIFLHHTNKPNKELNELIYAGSSAWEEDASNAFILHQNDYKKAFLFTPFKNRIGDLKPIAFKYHEDNTLSQINYLEASETEEIEEMNAEIQSFIEEQNQKPTYSKIMQHLQKEGYPRNKSNSVLKAGEGRYWKVEKTTKNFKSLYSLIKQPVIIEYETVHENSPYKSDKSDKSFFRVYFNINNSNISPDKSPDTIIELPFLTG